MDTAKRDKSIQDQEHQNQRFHELRTWVEGLFGCQLSDIQPASADASFRRYFRLSHDDQTWIIMDAPPEKEDSEPFVRVSGYLSAIGLNVPKVIESAVEQGFYLLTDLGRRAYLDHLHEGTVNSLYQDAMQAIEIMHRAGSQYQDGIPPYNRELLHTEMALFTNWYLARHHGVELNDAQHAVIESTYSLLSDAALEQPKVFVHRDYHSRNLMLVDENNPGILDFQDAVWGPITYDLVSLLRDCYITWPRERVESWLQDYYERLVDDPLLEGVSQAQFLRWFNLMGIQRHLKATGIFARLNYRDGKPGYLNDIPRTLGYVFTVAKDYQELKPFLDLLNELGIPQKIKQQLAGRSA